MHGLGKTADEPAGGPTLHHKSAQRGTPHPTTRSVGRADINSRMLQRHVGDHQVPRAQNLDTFHSNGATICTTDRGDG